MAGSSRAREILDTAQVKVALTPNQWSYVIAALTVLEREDLVKEIDIQVQADLLRVLAEDEQGGAL